MTDTATNGWSKYQMYVITELERQADVQINILDVVNKLDTRLAVQETNTKWISAKVATIVSFITAGIIGVAARFIGRG